MKYINRFKIFGFVLALSCFLSKVQAVPFQLGITLEPGFEYNSVDLKNLTDIKDLNNYIKDKTFTG